VWWRYRDASLRDACFLHHITPVIGVARPVIGVAQGTLHARASHRCVILSYMQERATDVSSCHTCKSEPQMCHLVTLLSLPRASSLLLQFLSLNPFPSACPLKGWRKKKSCESRVGMCRRTKADGGGTGGRRDSYGCRSQIVACSHWSCCPPPPFSTRHTTCCLDSVHATVAEDKWHRSVSRK